MRTQHALVAALFIVLATTMTWPLARNLDRAVSDPEDPFLNTWILDWDWHATRHWLPLFHANSFYPARYTLAFSENEYGIAIFLFPLRAAGVTPLAAHNVALLAGFAFSGFAAYLLGRFLTQSAWAGIAAGIFYAFVPFRFTQIPHVQHVVGGWLPLLLLALLQYARTPSWRRAAWFGAVFMANALTTIHAMLFGAVAIAIAALIVRPKWIPLLTATAIALALLVPFLYPYYKVAELYGMRRGWGEAMSFSARPGDWLVSSSSTLLYRGLLGDRGVDPERWLFPGALSIVLAAIGLSAMLEKRREVSIAAVWILLGFLGSLGLHSVFHRFLFLHVPGFQAIRVPARWAVITYVGLAMLIALGTARLSRKQWWIGAIIALAFALELRAARIRWYMALPEPPPVYRWIAGIKPRAIAELPMGEANSEYRYLFYATAHHRPMVNSPGRQARVGDAWLDEMQRIGVDTVIVHGNAIGAAVRPWLRDQLQRGRLQFVRRFDAGLYGDWVFSISNTPAPHRDELEAFLRGAPTFSESTFGVLDSPLPGQRLSRAWFEGFAFSPYGIREVNLLFNNGAIRVPMAPLADDPALRRSFPWYDATARPRFGRAFDRRPPGVWPDTDVQMEIIDGDGRRTLLEDRFVSWP